MTVKDFVKSNCREISTDGLETLEPNAGRMIHALRQVGYTLEQALADLIDNSICANSRTVLIRFYWRDERITSVAIGDDGEGMTGSVLVNAMQFGSRAESARSLGKFGMGLKLASLSHGRCLTVLSRRKGRSVGARWTLTGVRKGWQCEVLNAGEVRQHLNGPWNPLEFTRNGTLVIWDDVDKLPTNGRGIRFTIRALQTRLQMHLGLHFHRFIERGELRILLDQQMEDSHEQPFRVEIAPLDPVNYPCSGAAGFPRTYKAYFKDIGKLKLHAHIWPSNSDLPQYKLGNRAASRQGFYFYRNDRLIQAGGWNGIVQNETEPHSSLARVVIDLPAAFDEAFSLNVQKSAIVVPPYFGSAARNAQDTAGRNFEEFRGIAQEVYRSTTSASGKGLPFLPGRGFPAKVRHAASQGLQLEENGYRELDFIWKRLPQETLFEFSPEDPKVFVNSIYRGVLANDGESPSKHATVFKTLIYFILEDEIRAERISHTKRRRWSRINRVLTDYLEELSS